MAGAGADLIVIHDGLSFIRGDCRKSIFSIYAGGGAIYRDADFSPRKSGIPYGNADPCHPSNGSCNDHPDRRSESGPNRYAEADRFSNVYTVPNQNTTAERYPDDHRLLDFQKPIAHGEPERSCHPRVQYT